MAIFKSLISALATYSKIPMPNIEYKENEGRFSMCFFPVVGIIILLFEEILLWLSKELSLNSISISIAFILIPVLVSGGIHIDGFMDVCDALSSYRDRKKRVEILDDPHIGAFCVIKLLIVVGIWLIACNETTKEHLLISGLGFIFARILSAYSVVSFKASKTTGMLYFVKSHASAACKIILIIEYISMSIISIMVFNKMLVLPIFLLLIWLFYYKHKVEIDFGGISGDTSGYFLVICETIWMISVMILVKFAFIL